MSSHWDKPRGVEYDLHNHTDISKDGRISGKRLIDFAVKRGLKGIGICEHDAFPDESLFAYAKQKRIELALGIEFSCHKAHIIGYDLNFEPQDRQRLKERFAGLRETTDIVIREILSGLRKLGISVTYEELRAYAGKPPQKMFLFKYLAEELRVFPSWSEARRYLYQEGLYISDNEGVEELHPVEAVELIHRAGGTAIWAHPFFTPPSLRREYFHELVQAGLDGIEVAYAYRQNGYVGSESNAVLEARMLAMLSGVDLAMSGGSDSHYPVKTDELLKPVMPGDAGITDQDADRFRHIFQ